MVSLHQKQKQLNEYLKQLGSLAVAFSSGVDSTFLLKSAHNVVVLLSNTLLSIGAPGVPGSAIACFAALSSIAGLPAGIMGVYISVNTLADMGATCCNVLGDLACTVAMKRTVKLNLADAQETTI